MSEYGHQGAAPTNMDADQVVINELQRCVLEDGGASVASDLYTLYALDKKHVITGPQELLDDLAVYYFNIDSWQLLLSSTQGRLAFVSSSVIFLSHRRLTDWCRIGTTLCTALPYTR